MNVCNEKVELVEGLEIVNVDGMFDCYWVVFVDEVGVVGIMGGKIVMIGLLVV